MPPLITTREVTLDDLDAVLSHVQAGFDTYAEFAPPGWRPPSVADERERSGELLAAPDTWGLLALAEGRSVGHVAFFAARERSTSPTDAVPPPPIPGLAHLWQLFVVPEWWGRGVAPLLHGRAVDEMCSRGYDQARLFTPSQHVRARRFYERRGWALVDEEWHDGLNLTLSEYRLRLDLLVSPGR